MSGNFNNTGRLVKFMLKRELVISTAWILIIVLFSMGIAPGMAGMFDTEAREQFVSNMDNPVMIAMMGPVYGADNYTSGAMYTGMMLLWILITVGIMNVFLVSRHTRADEEKGRAEVVRSLPVGRLANLNATMITAFIINVILGLLMGLALAVTGVESMDLAGSMLYGALNCAVGLVFAAITALFCQLSSNKGGATGLSFLILGVFYMIRAVGDMQQIEILSCISPLGLALRSQAYIENIWWPVFILLLESIIIAAIAYKLNAVRDLDQGFIPARPGKKEASAFLRSNFGLAFRLLRTSLIVWLIVMFSLGASYGSIIGNIDEFVGGSPEYMQILGFDSAVAEATKENIQMYFLSFVASMMTLVCIVPLINAVMKPKNEEKEHRAEQVLARVVPRFNYIAAYTALAYAASLLLQFLTAVGIYSSAVSIAGDANPFALGTLLKACLSYLPALWVMIGVAVLLVGFIPKAAGAIWGYFGFVFIASFMGEVLGFPEWLLSVSPLHHISNVILGDDISFMPLIILTVIAAVLTAAGFIFYSKRDTQA
ncbi:MAG: ABC transporter permease [Oscillospiraceae bacterium]|nr:ABC transporter permease [Oscillospiraceae bacterium]